MYKKLGTERDRLTKQEKVILQHLAYGLENKEIGARLGITAHTVKTHVSRIIRKFCAKNRVHVAFIAGAGGLVQIK